MSNELIKFWRRCDLTNAPFVHPDDWATLRSKNGRYIDKEVLDFHSFISSRQFGEFCDTRFNLSLLPIPYGGNLNAADIVILLLNPSFTFSDYFAESCVPKFRDRLMRMILQDFSGIDFPFIWLDPEFCWHGGFSWWERKLRDVIKVVAAKKFNGRYVDALKNISQRIAHIELFPYRSRSFKAHKLTETLPSVTLARLFTQEVLVPEADHGMKKIIVTRQAQSWKLPASNKNIIVYKGGLTRGASLGPNTPGGKAILSMYDIEH